MQTTPKGIKQSGTRMERKVSSLIGFYDSVATVYRDFMCGLKQGYCHTMTVDSYFQSNCPDKVSGTQNIHFPKTQRNEEITSAIFPVSFPFNKLKLHQEKKQEQREKHKETMYPSTLASISFLLYRFLSVLTASQRFCCCFNLIADSSIFFS